MKFMLIALNVILVAAVAHLAWTYSSEPLTFASTSKKFSPSKLERKRAAATVKRVEKNPLDSPEVTEKKIAAVLDRNIFKTERVPDAPANKNAQRNNQQIRADMSLVGTYVIGDSLGAIILQRLQGNSQQQLKALQRKLKITMVYVTHDQEEAFALSDRIMVLNDMRIAQMDTPYNLYHNPADAFVKRFVADHLALKVQSIEDSIR